jgi:hypothetical protein
MFGSCSLRRAGNLDFILQFILEYFVVIFVAIVSGIVAIILITVCRGHAMWINKKDGSIQRKKKND